MEFIKNHKDFILHNEILHHIIFTTLNIIILCFVLWLGLNLIDKIEVKLIEILKKRDTNSILLRFMPLLNKVSKVVFVFVFV